LHLLDTSYERKAWHGPNLRGSLRGVAPATAAWRPGKGRRNIWEIAVHAAYWKYAVRRRLLGEPRGAFPLSGSNWFPRPQEMSTGAWRADLDVLAQAHRELRDAVAGLRPADLGARPGGSKYSNRDLIAGIAAHDVYHAGQIQVLKRLAGQAGAEA
jgi:uncharacterized damage-inducible protein DinB